MLSCVGVALISQRHRDLRRTGLRGVTDRRLTRRTLRNLSQSFCRAPSRSGAVLRSSPAPLTLPPGRRLRRRARARRRSRSGRAARSGSATRRTCRPRPTAPPSRAACGSARRCGASEAMPWRALRGALDVQQSRHPDSVLTTDIHAPGAILSTLSCQTYRFVIFRAPPVRGQCGSAHAHGAQQ